MRGIEIRSVTWPYLDCHDFICGRLALFMLFYRKKILLLSSYSSSLFLATKGKKFYVCGAQELVIVFQSYIHGR